MGHYFSKQNLSALLSAAALAMTTPLAHAISAAERAQLSDTLQRLCLIPAKDADATVNAIIYPTIHPLTDEGNQVTRYAVRHNGKLMSFQTLKEKVEEATENAVLAKINDRGGCAPAVVEWIQLQTALESVTILEGRLAATREQETREILVRSGTSASALSAPPIAENDSTAQVSLKPYILDAQAIGRSAQLAISKLAALAKDTTPRKPKPAAGQASAPKRLGKS